MKRHAVALLIQPYKNELIPPEQLKEAVNSCVDRIIALIAQFQNLRYNLVLPGYLLELIDPFKLTRLRELNKHSTIEWLVSGFTEPFVSLSPPWLTRENVRAGITTVAHLLEQNPSGYVPPFSNWEPHAVEIYRELGLQYVVLANALFPAECNHRLGHWSTEHLGSSTILIPLQTLHPHNAPADIGQWLANLAAQDSTDPALTKMIGVRYLLPLQSSSETDGFAWLANAAATFDRKLLEYQTVRFSEYLSDNPPLGLQYLPSGMLTSNRKDIVLHSFRNWLFSHDQVGILHRKLLEVCDLVAAQESLRANTALLRELFFVQDINRFRPCDSSGFSQVSDRRWSYRALIEIDRKLSLNGKSKGAQARIADYLRNGSKSIILSNKFLKIFIDHRCGAGIYEFDYAPRSHNLAAVYVRRATALPQILSPGQSRVLFSDSLLPSQFTHSEFSAASETDLGDFRQGRFEYSVKKTAADVKVVLSRNGALLQGERHCPLTIEKVFSLGNTESGISFVYQLSNNSMMAYSAVLAVELAVLLPGALSGKAHLRTPQGQHTNLATERFAVDNLTEFSLDDSSIGFKLTITTQKAINLWYAPIGNTGTPGNEYQGSSVVMTLPVQLDENATWKFMGRLALKKIRPAQREGQHAV